MLGRPVRDIQQAINFQQPEQAPYLRRSHHYPQLRSTGGGTFVGLHDGAPAQSQNVVALMSAVTVPPWLTAEARASTTRLA
jgi:hypothetical protein